MDQKIKSLPIRHVGAVFAVCGNKTVNTGYQTENLGYKRYKQMGIKERFRGEEKHRICGNCLRVLKARETF